MAARRAPELRAALQAGARRVEVRTQLAGNQPAGGYTVPEELQTILIRAMAAWGPMYDPGFAFEVPTPTGAAMPIPTIDDTAQTAEAGTEGQPTACLGRQGASPIAGAFSRHD